MNTKQLFLLFIGLFLLISSNLFAGNNSTTAQANPNSPKNPYIINDYATLQKYSDIFNNADNKFTKTEMQKYQTAHYKITADITISSNDWKSIGTTGFPFQGYIYGGGHTITIEADDYVFGVVSSKQAGKEPTIRDLKIVTNNSLYGFINKATSCNIVNIQFTGTLQNNTKKANLGAIVSQAKACFINECTYTGTIQNFSSEAKIGGILGNGKNNTITSCSTTSTIQNFSSEAKIGGILGTGKNNTIESCSTNGTIQNNGNQSVIGGLAGKLSGGSIKDCNNNNNINQEAINGCYGGIVAIADNTTIIKCRNKGTIIGSSNNNSTIGGIVAKATNSPIKNSINEAALSKAYKIGGIVALNIDSNIEKCYNKANITDAETIGGIVGEVTKESTSYIFITDCHNTLNSNLSNAFYTAGIIGLCNESTIVMECSNKGDISTKTIGAGIIGKATKYTTIYKSINIGSVESPKTEPNSIIAGIIAENHDYLKIEYVGNYGNINGNNGVAAGIIACNLTISAEIENNVQCSYILANNMDKIYPITNYGNPKSCYYDKNFTSSTTENGKFTAELKNASLRTGANGNGYTDSNWDFTQGYYLVPKPFTHFGNIDPNINLTAITNPVTVVYINNNQIYDYKKNQNTIQFPNNPTAFDGYTFVGWSYKASEITLASNNSSIYTEKLNHKANTELKLYAVWNKDGLWNTNAAVKELVIDDQLTLNKDASYSQIIVKPGATLVIGYDVVVTCDRLTLMGVNLQNDQRQPQVKFLDDISSIEIKNGWMYARLTDGFDYTYFSLPYDCTKNDVYSFESEKAAYGSNWIVKTYNAEKRATNGTGTTNWKADASPTIKAGEGYIFGTTFSNKQTFYFKPKNKQTSLKFNSNLFKVKPTNAKSQNISNNNWNLCGSYYTSSLNCNPTFEADDNSRAPRNLYISVPDAENNGTTFSYLSTMENNFRIPAFSVFYTQAVTTGSIIIDAQQQRGNAPQRIMQVPSTSSQIFNDLTFTCSNNQTQAKDNMGISLSDQGLLAYELGFDYEKRVGFDNKPQIYTIADNNKLAYNDIAYIDAVNLPMGLYAPIGSYTLSMNRMQQKGIKNVFLLDNETGMNIDLMIQDYSFQVETAEETMTRFTITVVQGTASPTDIENIEKSNNISFNTNDLGFVINNAPINSRFLVVDATGKIITQGEIIDAIQTIENNNSGIYIIQLQTPDGQNYTYKTIL